MSPDLIIMLYISLAICVIFGLWLFYDKRELESYKSQKVLSVFYCVKCGSIYSMGKEKERTLCPKCNFKNNRLKF